MRGSAVLTIARHAFAPVRRPARCAEPTLHHPLFLSLRLSPAHSLACSSYLGVRCSDEFQADRRAGTSWSGTADWRLFSSLRLSTSCSLLRGRRSLTPWKWSTTAVPFFPEYSASSRGWTAQPDPHVHPPFPRLRLATPLETTSSPCHRTSVLRLECSCARHAFPKVGKAVARLGYGEKAVAPALFRYSCELCAMNECRLDFLARR